MDNDGSLKVPYIKGNIERCICSECPVQRDSKCAQNKLEKSKKIMANMSGDDAPDPKEVPGVYCSIGKASCSDLKLDQKCICNACDVWKEYVLKNSTPSMYFCQNGQAKE